MPSEVNLFLEFINQAEEGYMEQPANEEEILAFETRYEVKLPSDVREFFLKINGAYEYGGFIGIETLSEWSLASEYVSQWKMSTSIERSENYFRFGNYDISVWDWLIILSDKPEAPTPVFVWQYPGDKVVKIADSFSDFLRKYRIHGAESLLGYD